MYVSPSFVSLSLALVTTTSLLAGCTSPELAKLQTRKAELEAEVKETKKDWNTDFKLRLVTYQIEAMKGRHTPEELCRQQIKFIGTAAEMASTKTEGRYPEKVESLVPAYFDTLPICPNGTAYGYQAITDPSDQNETTCSSHGLTYNSLTGLQ